MWEQLGGHTPVSALERDRPSIYTWHVHAQLAAELVLHAPLTRKYNPIGNPFGTGHRARHAEGETVRRVLDTEAQARTYGYEVGVVRRGVASAIEDFVAA